MGKNRQKSDKNGASRGQESGSSKPLVHNNEIPWQEIIQAVQESEKNNVAEEKATQDSVFSQREIKIQVDEVKLKEKQKILFDKEIALTQLEKEVESEKNRLNKLQDLCDKKHKRNVEEEKELNANLLTLRLKQDEILKKETFLKEELQEKKDLFLKELLEEKLKKQGELSEYIEEKSKEISLNLARSRQSNQQMLEQERLKQLSEMDQCIQSYRDKAFEKIDEEVREKMSSIEKLQEENKEKTLQLEFETLRFDSNKKKLEEKMELLLEENQEKVDAISLGTATEIQLLKEEKEHLQQIIEQLQHGQSYWLKIKEAYGESPDILIKELQDLKAENTKLLELLASAPSQYDENRYLGLVHEYEVLTEKMIHLELHETTINSLEHEKKVLSVSNKNLEEVVKSYNAECETLRNRLERLSVAEPTVADRDMRIQEIQSGFQKKIMQFPPMEVAPTEIDWLRSIQENCKKFQVVFPNRILYAFHSSLKIADWSTITVLAGISGTGKSELPRLYATFGGLNFISVPVQPNWDSQEAMLGFFNSIDNRFDPQPLLRFLSSSTEHPELKEIMSIVLLDEMNLAHVELYFADFLSKLESRRGMSRSSVPTVEVKLGVGYEPYQLKLDRSVLWSGTMNQDETTKSLSDKVLDRGVVIHFPRPKTLNSRTTGTFLEKLLKEANISMLTRKVWFSWVVDDILFSEKQQEVLQEYKKLVEKINDILGKSGRALGHRIWQSVEYYVANYPLVLEQLKLAQGEASRDFKMAVKIAMEDQMVQKIMPKLRGIETRGQGKEALQTIKDLLKDHFNDLLLVDFDNACSHGFGQFVWCTSEYMDSTELDYLLDKLENSKKPEENTEEKTEENQQENPNETEHS